MSIVSNTIAMKENKLVVYNKNEIKTVSNTFDNYNLDKIAGYSLNKNLKDIKIFNDEEESDSPNSEGTLSEIISNESPTIELKRTLTPKNVVAHLRPVLKTTYTKFIIKEDSIDNKPKKFIPPKKEFKKKNKNRKLFPDTPTNTSQNYIAEFNIIIPQNIYPHQFSNTLKYRISSV